MHHLLQVMPGNYFFMLLVNAFFTFEHRSIKCYKVFQYYIIKIQMQDILYVNREKLPVVEYCS